jgi:hypothetical protein
MHLANVKIGQLIETKENDLVYVLDILDDLNFHAIDFDTNQKNYFLTTCDVKRVIDLPENVKPMWVKRIEKIMKGCM